MKSVEIGQQQHVVAIQLLFKNRVSAQNSHNQEPMKMKFCIMRIYHNLNTDMEKIIIIRQPQNRVAIQLIVRKWIFGSKYLKLKN